MITLGKKFLKIPPRVVWNNSRKFERALKEANFKTEKNFKGKYKMWF